MMLALVLLLTPLIHSAPQSLHSHSASPPCDTTICRVSDQSLDSALSTFLCFTKKETSAMDEVDKKRELAAAVAPYIEDLEEDELVALGSESLVSLVNLVLHAGSHKVVKKTKQQHREELINSVTSAGNKGLKSDFFKDVDPILLGIMNCQSSTIAQIQELIMSVAEKEDDRAARALVIPFFNKLIDESKLRKNNLKAKPEKAGLPDILALKLPQRLADKLGILDKLRFPDAISLFDKSGINNKVNKPQQLSVLDILPKPNLPEVPSVPDMLHDFVAPEGFRLGEGMDALGDMSLHDIYDMLEKDNLNLHKPEELSLAHLPEQLSLAHFPEELHSHLKEELSLEHVEGQHDHEHGHAGDQHDAVVDVGTAAGINPQIPF